MKRPATPFINKPNKATKLQGDEVDHSIAHGGHGMGAAESGTAISLTKSKSQQSRTSRRKSQPFTFEEDDDVPATQQLRTEVKSDVFLFIYFYMS